MSILVLLLGWLAGGLADAFADSLPLGRQLRRPSCAGCGAPRRRRAWLAWVGVATGTWECAYCGRPGQTRHLLVELVAAVGAFLIFRGGLGPSGPWVAMVVAWVFLVVVLIDLEHRLIPHALTLPAALVLGGISILDPSRGPVKTLAGGAAGFLMVWVLYLLGGLFAGWISRRRGEPLDEVAFGFGDVTLSGVIGLVVGWPGVVLALFIGILAAGGFQPGRAPGAAIAPAILPLHAFPLRPFPRARRVACLPRGPGPLFRCRERLSSPIPTLGTPPRRYSHVTESLSACVNWGRLGRGY